ncbi:MAG: hypothetical protein AB7O28_14950 [Vicinamibacterales bacterium]
MSPSRVLVVAATPRELAAGADWDGLVCGVGPVEAAAATAAAVARVKPLAVLHVGIAGARAASGLQPPALVIGSETLYCDLGVPERWAPRRLSPDPRLLAAARRALPGAVERLIGTSGRVGQTDGCDVEAMEGFAILRAAALAGVPAIEVRAISNAIEEPDRSRWRFDDAFAAIVGATPALAREVAACLS